jgi:formiminotetrahydrofolate cyclodeaminase
MGAGLVSMVANLTLGRPRYQAVEPEMRRIVVQSEELRLRLETLAADDVAAYARVAAAYKLPRGSDEERAQRHAAIQLALQAATAPPLATLQTCRAILPLALEAAAHGNVNVVSDAGVAAELAAAGVQSSRFNVEVNLSAIADEQFVARIHAEVVAAAAGLDDSLDRVRGIVRAKLSPQAKP